MATSTELSAAILEVRDNLGGDLSEAELAEALRRTQENWSRKLRERVSALPWWVLSSITHGLLFLIAVSLTVALPKQDETDVVPSTVIMIAPPRPGPEAIIEKRPKASSPEDADTCLPKSDVDDARVVVVEEVPLSHLTEEQPEETITSLTCDPARIPPGEITPIGMAQWASIGVPSGIAPGFGGLKEIRSSLRTKLAKLHQSEGTIGRVDLALEWLARHQEADGRWDSRKHEIAEPSRPAYVTDRADTALALMAFLGSGHTPSAGRYADNVARALAWLLGQQQPDGAFFTKTGGYKESAGYQHAICALALTEAYGMTGDTRLREAAQRAVDFSIERHQSGYSGWRYDPGRDADLSVTGWFVMQIKSAQIAGLRVDAKGLQGAMNFLNKCTDREGRGKYVPGQAPSPAMTAVGMVCRTFSGLPASDPAVQGAALHLGTHPPRGGKEADAATFYYWYYGTLGLFQYGGDEWRKWNDEMKRTLLDSQCLEGDRRGSWDPVGRYDRIAGRVYTTAMAALTLEVYYRYLQICQK
jgi:hypothetical protein